MKKLKKGWYRKSIDKLLRIVEVLTELKTGRPAFAEYKNTFSLWFWYSKKVDDLGTTETYFIPFAKVKIFTPTSFSK